MNDLSSLGEYGAVGALIVWNLVQGSRREAAMREQVVASIDNMSSVLQSFLLRVETMLERQRKE